MFNEDEHQRPIHKLFYLITGTCNCGVRIRVPPPARREASASPCKPGSGAAQNAQRAGHVLTPRAREHLRQQKQAATAGREARGRARAT